MAGSIYVGVIPESVTERAFSSGNSRSTWPDVATIDSALIFSAGKQAEFDAEAEALQRETALTVMDSLCNKKPLNRRILCEKEN